MFFNAKNGRITTDDSYIDYVSFGKGDKDLVLIPGLNVKGVRGSASALAYMYRLFAKEYKVYVIDRKNYIPDGYTVEDIADDTAYAMKKLGITKADIMGISQGGMVAQMLAVVYPELVSKLVLGVTLSKQNDTVKSVIKRWIDHAENGNYIAINRETVTLMYSDAYIRKNRLLLPIAVRLIKPHNMHRFAVLAQSCITFDCYDELNNIRCPVFVIGAKQDKIVTGKASYEIADKLGCQIYMYDGLGHAAYEEAKDFNSRVIAFLKGHDNMPENGNTEAYTVPQGGKY